MYAFIVIAAFVIVVFVFAVILSAVLIMFFDQNREPDNFRDSQGYDLDHRDSYNDGLPPADREQGGADPSGR